MRIWMVHAEFDILCGMCKERSRPSPFHVDATGRGVADSPRQVPSVIWDDIRLLCGTRCEESDMKGVHVGASQRKLARPGRSHFKLDFCFFVKVRISAKRTREKATNARRLPLPLLLSRGGER